ncbi:MAG TPA: dNTP triphosphohydrolase [Longimicrobium sp.]|nr:dNTP triphosphohydrolase [Longimicrobium sp.]
MSGAPGRYDRRHEEPAKEDQRQAGQRDRDRILYTSAFRRLAGVTQVVAPLEGHIFHNRLTHTLEVAQIARRLAEKLRTDHPTLPEAQEIDPDVAEAAAMAHDLGHPPFGHIGEQALDKLARKHGAPDGFEGNAQSFRILAHGSSHRTGYRGLNLTRATLNAVLKYPWPRDLSGAKKRTKKYRKFGAYAAEAEDLAFARDGFGESDEQSVEAAIMDYADEIAYSVHDLDDFYRAGLVPLDRIASSTREFSAFLDRSVAHEKLTAAEIAAHRETFENLLFLIVREGVYTGTVEQRAQLRTASSVLIKDFVFAASLRQAEAGLKLDVPEPRRVELKFLQALVWDFVIINPRLATQQHGQRRIIRRLFYTYLRAVMRRDRALVPPAFHLDLEELGGPRHITTPAADETRLAVDIVARLTDDQAVMIYRRLIGVAPGSVAEILPG